MKDKEEKTLQFGFTNEDIRLWQDKPFLLEGKKDTAVIIFHGWSALPKQAKPLAEFINGQGYLTYVPLLTGHGTHPDDLLTVKGEMWVKDVENAIKLVRQKKHIKKIVLVGISLGGNISLLASLNKKVDGIVLLGTPIHLKNHFGVWVGSILLPIFKKYIKKSYPKSIRRDLDFFNTTSYQYHPTINIREVLKVARRCAFSLPKIKTPLLILQTNKDYLVAKYSPWVIYNSVSSKIKKLQWIKLESEDHVFVQSEMKEYYSLVLNFVDHICAKNKKR